MESKIDIEQETKSQSKCEYQSNPKTAGRRIYECIFCKRGFSNAQALGGHMNIHRKDRARPSRPIRPIDSSPFPVNNSIVPRIGAGALRLPQWMNGVGGGAPSRQLTLFGNDGLISGPEEVVEELDLELRLGPQRPRNVSMGLKEFLRCKFD